MRVYMRRVFQLTLALFLIAVLYLNLNVSYLSDTSGTRSNNKALPWGESFDQAGQRPSLIVADSKFHEHLRNGSIQRQHVTTAKTTPAPDPDLDIYPSKPRYEEDRIMNQLKFTAPAIEKEKKAGQPVQSKKIFIHGGVGSWGVARGQGRFKDDQCQVQDCDIVDDASKLNDADVVLFKNVPYDPKSIGRPLGQVWVLFMLESPYHTPSFTALRNVFNWTATYRHDSTIVAPYEKYIPTNGSMHTRTPIRNYAEGKTKKVAWFVSNCGARNQRRMYAEQLGQHIQVDIYGGCGNLKCPRAQSDKCFDMLNTDYKFYLAFENSNCRDYITEKFFINALKHDVIPIVMGAAPEDYKRASPPKSFIHVDEFETPQAMAEYLHKLDKDDNLYNEYFAWKGLWDNINTFFWCRMCHLAHDIGRRGHSWFEDVESWWRGPGVCIGPESWRNAKRNPDGLIQDLAVRD